MTRQEHGETIDQGIAGEGCYVAEVSYAVYVVHGMLTATWLGGANSSSQERYLRRPSLIATTFILAHISTRYYEQRWMRLGKWLALRSVKRTV